MTFNYTIYQKPASDGPLSKRIELRGKEVVPDGSTCVMHRGTAYPAKLETLEHLPTAINAMSPQQALSLGRIPEAVVAGREAIDVVSARNLGTSPGAIARDRKTLVFTEGEPALMLIDFDRKGMPPAVRDKVEKAGGLWPAICAAVPAMKNVGHVIRPSTSAGIRRSDTGQEFPSSGGLHVYLLVEDGSDIPRALGALFDLMWLAGLGWYMIAKDGNLLDRSVIDRMVGSPERLVFEGAPMLVPPLVQDAAAREAAYHPGTALDTRRVLPDLAPSQQVQLRHMKEQAKNALAADAAAVRAAYDLEHARGIAARTGCPVSVAQDQVRLRHDGKLPPQWLLEFDDPAHGVMSVADVMADPVRFVGETLSDPVEGLSYGRGKAMVIARETGGFFIHSFAHGRATYDLVYDEATIMAIAAQTQDKYLLPVICDAMVDAAIDQAAYDRIRSRVSTKAGVGFRAFNAAMTAARDKKSRREREAAAARAVFLDTRTKMVAPAFDAELMATVRPIDANLAHHSADPMDPVLRNSEGNIVSVVYRQPHGLHELGASADSGTGEGAETGAGPNPVKPPAQPVPALEVQTGPALRMLVERHIRLVKTSRKGDTMDVSLAEHFVNALSVLPGSVIPICDGIQLVPLVMAGRRLLAPMGYDPGTRLLFRVDPALRELLPKHEDCTPEAAKKAWEFLSNVFMANVATGNDGKAQIVAALATVVQRHLLPEAPAFIVRAGQRGDGKTTLLNMVSMAALGVTAAAASWSKEPEERRKALFSAARDQVPFLVFDNVTRGVSIDCEHVNKHLTSATVRDRILGSTKTAEYAASTVVAFTGNAIGPKGDFSSRVMVIELNAGRPDPENRNFKHADPIGWVREHRNEILAALYTILMVPRPVVAQAKTRFKTWWNLIGHPIEVVSGVDFGKLLSVQEQKDDETTAVVKLFAALWAKHGAQPFKASDVVEMLDPSLGATTVFDPAEEKKRKDAAQQLRDALVVASGGTAFPPGPTGVDARRVGLKLSALEGRSVDAAGTVLQLKAYTDRTSTKHYTLGEQI